MKVFYLNIEFCTISLMLRLLPIGSGFIATMLSLVKVECYSFRVANVVFAQLSLVEFELGNYFLEDELHAVA